VSLGGSLKVLDESSAGEAWYSPGVYQVVPGVWRIPLELPDQGLHSVNVYALASSDAVTLIDAGQAVSGSRERLERGLDAIGFGPDQVAQILVTHIHRDHYTNAVAMRRDHDLKIMLGAEEAISLPLVQDPTRDRYGTQLGLLREAGAAKLAEFMTGLDDGVPPGLWEAPDVWLRPGTVVAGDRVLDVLPTPGHTRGHVVFGDSSAELTFSGDHVLPHITPSIGFEPAAPRLPLMDYLNSLRLMLNFPDTRLLPAHGQVTASVHRRVEELLEHHADRLEASLLPLEEGSTAFEVAGRLSWTRRLRGFGELSPVNQMLAVLETKAHLDVLVATNRASCNAVPDGPSRYRAR
jgi:glyoxylase-like metal-dependent hydrolase (beta-lactamase superfamily II)